MLHSCRNALFYFLLFNSSLNPLEFKFELNCLNLLLKKKENLSLTLSPFSPTHSHFPFPSPFLFLSPRAQGQRRGPFPHARPSSAARLLLQPDAAPSPDLPLTGGAHMSGSSSFTRPCHVSASGPAPRSAIARGPPSEPADPRPGPSSPRAHNRTGR